MIHIVFHFKFQSDSINTDYVGDVITPIPSLNSNLILLIQE